MASNRPDQECDPMVTIREITLQELVSAASVWVSDDAVSGGGTAHSDLHVPQCDLPVLIHCGAANHRRGAAR